VLCPSRFHQKPACFVRIKERGIEEMPRVMECLMIVPPEKVSVSVRIAFIRHGISQVHDPRPRHRRCQDEKTAKDQEFPPQYDEPGHKRHGGVWGRWRQCRSRETLSC